MYRDENEDSSEDFEITLENEQEAPSETADLLNTYGIDSDTIADKPWKKPGEDITDYFNYGFNEVTWKEYISKQKGIREEYGGVKGRKRDHRDHRERDTRDHRDHRERDTRDRRDHRDRREREYRGREREGGRDSSWGARKQERGEFQRQG
ncbi:hypothetical protein NECID01_0156 [Nematocida sp. AWRm77]|nr:hypothetical protein NECID01_0156 [Nematocida sp. AWRm77]